MEFASEEILESISEHLGGFEGSLFDQFSTIKNPGGSGNLNKLITSFNEEVNLDALIADLRTGNASGTAEAKSLYRGIRDNTEGIIKSETEGIYKMGSTAKGVNTDTFDNSLRKLDELLGRKSAEPVINLDLEPEIDPVLNIGKQEGYKPIETQEEMGLLGGDIEEKMAEPEMRKMVRYDPEQASRLREVGKQLGNEDVQLIGIDDIPEIEMTDLSRTDIENNLNAVSLELNLGNEGEIETRLFLPKGSVEQAQKLWKKMPPRIRKGILWAMGGGGMVGSVTLAIIDNIKGDKISEQIKKIYEGLEPIIPMLEQEEDENNFEFIGENKQSIALYRYEDQNIYMAVNRSFEDDESFIGSFKRNLKYDITNDSIIAENGYIIFVRDEFAKKIMRKNLKLPVPDKIADNFKQMLSSDGGMGIILLGVLAGVLIYTLNKK